jgi:hypothetical protein
LPIQIIDPPPESHPDADIRGKRFVSFLSCTESVDQRMAAERAAIDF